MNNVLFYEEVDIRQSQEDFVVILPVLHSKQELYNELRNALFFPDDFSSNWDAFRELFYYMDDIKQLNIHLFHQSVAEIVPTWDLAMYLCIVNEVTTKDFNNFEHKFFFHFNIKEFDVVAKYWPGKIDRKTLDS
jgi:hypothetical protein